MKYRQIIGFAVMAILLLSGSAFSQREPDPNTGDAKFRRTGTMDGNLVRSIYINWGELAHWPDSPSGEWPKGTGHQYVDGVGLIVQGRTTDNSGNVIYPMETQYREFVDRGPNDELWGWAPLPGYFNALGTEPAMSDDAETWPTSWPDKDASWSGYWNGFFGKGVQNADLETFFVFDDDQDEEWDFLPDPSDPERRGMGIEVAARYFQWSQVLAEDVIFAVYFITNEGQTQYDSTYYSFYIDWGVGGTDDSSDDTGDYDTFLDIAWAWDFDGFGSPGRWSPVGVVGFAFLESPGIQDDANDNDDDGLVDEARDSGPGTFLDTPPYGVDDPAKFQDYFGYAPRPHWSGDEDGDWAAYTDINENGQWDDGEALNDDVGADGLGPNNFGYPGPDDGEGDGMPTAGEPNFDFTDKDESDQIGLTGFRIFPVHTYELWNENQNWGVFRSAPPPHSQQVTANLGMFFSSGPFPLVPGQTENYSMALLFGTDKDDLVLTKKTIQQIYNADYRFARPPDKPRLLSAIPGNGRVILTWDTKAEQSFDPFLQEFDFEGYRIYRATEPEFLETRLITDAYGRATFRKPIAQYDLKNGWSGLHPIDISGANFDLGTNSGLRHFFIDTNVKNGQTYYYAVVSYDHGLLDTSATGAFVGLPPAECTSLIQKDVAGNVTVDVNTAVVVPRAPAAGFVEPGVAENSIFRETVGTGDFQIDFLIPDSVPNNHEYEIAFGDTSYFHNAGASYYQVWDVTGSQRIAKTDTVWFEDGSQSPMFDGIVLTLTNDAASFNEANSGWLVGESTYRWRVTQDKRFSGLDLNIDYPADFEITFSEEIVDTAINRLGFPAQVPTKFKVYNVTEDAQANFQFLEYYEKDNQLTPYIPNVHSADSIESVTIWVPDTRPGNPLRLKTTWQFFLEKDANITENIAPAAGDVFYINTKKPFRSGDVIKFTTLGKGYDADKAKDDLENIAVVPNPYMVTASWEESSPFRFGRGERKMYFINLPAECTIRIYTTRGYLVDEIVHNSSIDNGQEAWNLLNKDGQEISYGVYIFHVTAPGIGEKVGKFAVIK